MKYSDKNPPLVCMQTNSTCYKGTGKMQIKGILWHDTGANNPNLELPQRKKARDLER